MIYCANIARATEQRFSVEYRIRLHNKQLSLYSFVNRGFSVMKETTAWRITANRMEIAVDAIGLR